MGLDVTAYRKLKKLDVLFDADGEPVDPKTRDPIDGFFKAYLNYDFPFHAPELEHRGVYSYSECESPVSISYGNYNSWREELASIAGYATIEDDDDNGRPSHTLGAGEVESGPFHELICFSDCDGAIGAKVSAKLAGDFAEWDERARALGDKLFYERYKKFRRCFEIAADEGAVDFH